MPGDVVLYWRPTWWERLLIRLRLLQPRWTDAAIACAGGLTVSAYRSRITIIPLRYYAGREAAVWRMRRLDEQVRYSLPLVALQHCTCPDEASPWRSGAHLVAHVYSQATEDTRPFGLRPHRTTAQHIAEHCARSSDWRQVLRGRLVITAEQ